MKKSLVMFVALVLAPWCRADVEQSLGNARTGMVVNADRSDWATVVAFAADSTGESGIGPFDVDWLRVSLAHEPDGLLFVRYELANGADFDSFPAFYNIFVDTDHDRDTGYLGGGSQLAVGADYLIQGVSVFAFSGAGQTDFAWTFVGAGTFDNSHTNLDLEMAVDPSQLGSPTSFAFVLVGDNELNGNTQDYYPDTSGGGSGGGFFVYRFSALVTQPVVNAVSVGSVAALEIDSRGGEFYQLQYVTNALSTNWAFAGHPVAGTGSNLVLFDPTGYSTAKTYRVIVP